MNRELLDKIETVFVVEDVYIKNNGIVNSVLRKMKIMKEEWGYSPVLLALNYNIELNKVLAMLRYSDFNEEQTHIYMGARVMGVYNYFQKSYGDLPVKTYKKEEGLIYKELKPGVFAVFDGNKHLRNEHYTTIEQGLRLVQRFDESERLSKEVYYDDFGYLSKIRVYDPENKGFYPLEYFYTTEQKCCIKAEYINEPDEFVKTDFKVKKLSVYDDDGNLVRECKNNGELAQLFFEKWIDSSKTYILCNETGRNSSSVLVDRPNVIKSIVVHSVFLDNSYDLKSKPQPFYRHMCENHTKFDAIVFLSERERRDFVKKYGDYRNTHTISHPYSNIVAPTPFEERDHMKAVIISRLDALKRIDLAIKIFKKVVDALPDVKLEIYGFGSVEQKCRDVVVELGLEKNVFVMGFTDDPISVFRKSAVSLMTSSAEGYPLTLAESICNGCPVFAFDIKYGPADIISNGVTGRVIPNNDEDGFANSLIEFFKNEGLQREMSENCYRESPQFGRDKLLDKWYALMGKLYKKL